VVLVVAQVVTTAKTNPPPIAIDQRGLIGAVGWSQTKNAMRLSAWRFLF
jgi:hypothetical protein